MVLSVAVASWQIEEHARILTVGEQVSWWLTFTESDRPGAIYSQVQELRGRARQLAVWPGAELGRFPTRVDADDAVIYWHAPEAVHGPVEVEGTVYLNEVDAPEGFPETSGVIERIRMTWRVPGGQRRRASVHFEDVASTYLPAHAPHWIGAIIDLKDRSTGSPEGAP